MTGQCKLPMIDGTSAILPVLKLISQSLPQTSQIIFDETILQFACHADGSISKICGFLRINSIHENMSRLYRLHNKPVTHIPHVSNWENSQRQELQYYSNELILNRCREKKSQRCDPTEAQSHRAEIIQRILASIIKNTKKVTVQIRMFAMLPA